MILLKFHLPTSFLCVWLVTLKHAGLILDEKLNTQAQSAQIRINEILWRNIHQQLRYFVTNCESYS